jgi:GntR family transcriptional regulator, arabinose operon transcriptional repressor
MGKSKKPLYEVIYRQYKTRIISGELTPGTRLPTEMEIAAENNVSRITVSRALRELEIEKFVYRVKGSGTYVSKNEWSESGQDSDDKTNQGKGLAFISLILPFLGDFSSDYLKGVEDCAKSEGYFVTLHNTADDSENEIEIIEETLSRGSHGLIIYPASETANLHMYSSMLIRNYPFVLIDRKVPGIDTSLVCADNYKGFLDVTSYLIDNGHKKIVFIGTDVNSISSEQERYRGFCKAHIINELPLMKKNLYSFNDIKKLPDDYKSYAPEEYRYAHFLFDLLETLIPEERPTAIAAVNDLLARLIMTTARERGISIPGDYSLTGFDNLPYAPHLPVPLTTVEQPAYEIGFQAAKILFSRIKEPGQPQENMTIQPSLVIRESSGKISM